MPSFRGWVCNEVAKLVNGFHKPTMDETFTVIRHDAEMRGRSALLQAMGAKNQFHVDADFHHAVNVIVRAVVAGVFGEIPLTDDEKAAKLLLFEKNFLAAFKVDFPEDSIWASQSKEAKPVTMSDIQEALHQASGVHPVQKGPLTGLPYAYGPVVMGRNAGKSGLPAAQAEVQAQEAALDELWATVAQKSDELLGVTQKAKYEELMGIDPEEI